MELKEFFSSFSVLIGGMLIVYLIAKVIGKGFLQGKNQKTIPSPKKFDGDIVDKAD